MLYFFRQKLKAIASSASNTWGLFLLILLLGVALVDIPRELWRSSQIDYTLRKVYFKLSKLNTEKLESEGALEDVLEVHTYHIFIYKTCYYEY